MPADPLEALRLPIVPVAPRATFTDDLLRRLQSASPPVRRSTPTVRYFVDDLDSAVQFYRDQLGFEEELRPNPTFAMLYRGDLRLLLSAPGGAHSPAGGNRVLIQVDDLDSTIDALREAGAHFLDDVPSGAAVRQVVLADPSGNPIELFEPAQGYHERTR
jgi:catechol 2,3-dioxygenase-like lactoylglutathione lyase family enzyme